MFSNLWWMWSVWAFTEILITQRSITLVEITNEVLILQFSSVHFTSVFAIQLNERSVQQQTVISHIDISCVMPKRPWPLQNTEDKALRYLHWFHIKVFRPFLKVLFALVSEKAQMLLFFNYSYFSSDTEPYLEPQPQISRGFLVVSCNELIAFWPQTESSLFTWAAISLFHSPTTTRHRFWTFAGENKSDTNSEISPCSVHHTYMFTYLIALYKTTIPIMLLWLCRTGCSLLFRASRGVREDYLSSQGQLRWPPKQWL